MLTLHSLQRAPIITEDEVELVLPNGKVLGHRSLNRYYKQNFKPEDVSHSFLSLSFPPKTLLTLSHALL